MSYQIIYDWAREQPAKTAVVFNGNIISYSAFATAIDGTCRHLETLALPEGHTVVVRISFLVDCWVAVLALQNLGVNTACVSSASDIEALSLHNVIGILTTELEAGPDSIEPISKMGDGVIVIPNPNYNSGEIPRPPTSKGITEIGGHILYTSGTTGSYKKVFLNAELQQARNAERIEAYRHRQAATIYNCTGFGLWTGVGYKRPLYVWQLGGCTVIEQRPQWYQYFLQSSLTNSILVPDQVSELLRYLDDQPLAKPLADCYLLVAGGFISNRLAEQLRQRVSPYLENIYGSTEINVPILRSTIENPDDLHWMIPSGYREVEIVDEEGNVCPEGTEGELRVRISELDCSAYLDDPPTSEKVFRSGYFYPGDIAVTRADGRIRILGRSVDVVNIRGQKRSPAPFEQQIQQRLGVEAACLFSGLTTAGEAELLIAIESDVWPEKPDLNALAREFAQYGEARFARITKFPRTQTGTRKIDRISLRKLLFTEQ